MKKLMLCFFSFLLCIPIGASCNPETAQMARQCEFNGIDYPNAVNFVKEFQAAIKLNDPLKVANLADYPLRINFSSVAGGKTSVDHRYIANKEEFIKSYNAIFSKELKIKLLKQASANIFCNYQGAMIADGAIWFTEKNKKMRIIALNV